MRQDLDSVMQSRSYTRLMELLEDGGEELVQKTLNFVEYLGQQTNGEEDLHKPFHRNCRAFHDLTGEQIRVLMQSFHGNLWAEQLAHRLRVQNLRCLLCWALRVEPRDFLPEKCLADLKSACQTRYVKSRPYLCIVAAQATY